MPDELFDPSTVSADSPKLKWMKKHGICVNVGTDYGSKDAVTHFTVVGREPIAMADGLTLDEALADYARQVQLKLWNEE